MKHKETKTMNARRKAMEAEAVMRIHSLMPKKEVCCESFCSIKSDLCDDMILFIAMCLCSDKDDEAVRV
ncbi:hypothetical protein DY000_02030032 [Brassica cretica]|uniref:Uncharacterized protein n=1 Tax=Brassica cretica TaxID=69181 RepID=A0ABQ7DI01_BRACR|nr:hypothetical protein DY000_02030032 [Brassica cretica]